MSSEELSCEASIHGHGEAPRLEMRAERNQGYDVVWVESLPAIADELFSALVGRRAVLIATPTVAELYGGALVRLLRNRGQAVDLLVFPCDESTKTMARVEDLCRHANRLGLDRSAVLVALSGGVCSDIVTLAASLLRRGLRHMRIPSTLLGMVDAGVGVKGAVNFAAQKNLLGCFYPPERVLICPRFLDSLSTRLLRAGTAEMAKVAIVADASLFQIIEAHGQGLIASRFQAPHDVAHRALWLSIRGLLDALRPNLFEDRTLVRSMDFGHTFSPLLEIGSEHALNHGEAVAIDMAFSTALALELGWIDPGAGDRILRLLKRLGLPCGSPLMTLDLCRESLEKTMRHRGGNLNLFLPTGIGRSRCLKAAVALTDDMLSRALRRSADGVLP